MRKPFTPKWTHLLTLPAVASWHANTSRRNQSTADMYLRRVARTCRDALGITPDALLPLTQEQLEDAVTRCISHEFRTGQMGSSVIQTVKALKSFLKWHSRKVERPNAVPGANEHPNAESCQIPDQNALQAVLKAAELRTQVMILVVGQGGQRLRVLGDLTGSNGLRLRDLVDLRITASDVEFLRLPCRAEVSRALSKTGKAFFFFLGPEACTTIRLYLLQRRQAGEALDPDSPLVRAEGGRPRFMWRNNISVCMRRAMRAANVEGPPYIWRSYYANRCQLVESKGFLEAWRKFFMGHRGNIQTQYANRKKLPADSIEAMRAAYQKALPTLETTLRPAEDPKPEMATVLLRAAGMSPDDIAKFDLRAKTTDELGDLMDQAMERRLRARGTATAPATAPAAATPASGARQKIVSLGELRDALAQGWIFRTTLPGDQAIVEHG